MLSEIAELKYQLSDASLSDELIGRISFHRSVSESGSHQLQNESIYHKKSIANVNEQSPEKLIETEKAETGNVNWGVYKYYLKSMGMLPVMLTLIFNMVFQGFSIGSNVWLGVWADDSSISENTTVDATKRNMYLAVYGAFGIGQS